MTLMNTLHATYFQILANYKISYPKQNGTQITSIDWNIINSQFNRFMIKDYVKFVNQSNFPQFLRHRLMLKHLSSSLHVKKTVRGFLLGLSQF